MVYIQLSLLALLEATNELAYNIDRVVVFLDLKKAFDTACRTRNFALCLCLKRLMHMALVE